MRHRRFLVLVLTLAGTPAVRSQSAAPTPPATATQAPAPINVQAAGEAQGGTVTGTVAAAATNVLGKEVPGTPLPGVTVTATNTLTGKKYAAATDITGTFRLLIPKNGRYVLRAEFAAFAPATAEVLLNATQHTGVTSFSMELASRAAARTATAGDTADAASALGLSGTQAQALRRGLQSLTAGGTDAAGASEASANSGASLPSLGGLADTAASGTDAVAVSGQSGQTNGLAGFNEDEIRERVETAIADARRNGGQQADIANAVVGLIGGMMSGPGGPGGFGGPGGGGSGGRGGRGGGGGGSFRNFNPTQIHGNLFYGGGNGALDATQFSLTGNAVHPAYSTNRFGLNLTGSPYIPGLFKPSTRQFAFLNITGSRNTNPVNLYGTVPTAAERTGDFSGFTRTVNGVPTVITVYDPLTGLPFAGNVIPQTRLSPQALALLNFYPTPNQPTTGATDTAQNYNYQRVATAGQHSLQIASRFVRNFGANTQGGGFGGGGGRRQQNGPATLRQNANASFAYSHTASDLRSFSPLLDGKSLSDGLNLSAGYSIGYGRLNNNASLTWNRSHADTSNLFTNGTVDPGTGLNIPKPQTVAPGFYNGVPTIGLTNFSSLTETNPADRLQQTISFGDQVRYNHKKHNMSFGVDLRHVQNNVLGGTNVVGSFAFTGYATQAPTTGTGTTSSTSSPTGSSFADFLLGAPQQAKIQAGLNKLHLRETVLDAYANDDWRVLPNLTLNGGLRYEYFAPYTETNNQLVNLDHSADFTTVAPVLPGAAGPFSGPFPRSLVNPDRTLFSPRLGLAYRPRFVKQTVLRAGYGISYNTSQFGSFANSLSYQVPFAVTQTNVAGTQGCGTVNGNGTAGQKFTLTSAYNCSTTAITNNYAVNKNYRLGRVQVVNAGVQHTFPLGVLLNVDYNGSYGANLDILRAPGRTPTTLISNSQGYIFEDSIAESRFNAVTVNARKRMSRGIALQATYVYGHSIDNASSIGGSGGNTVAQNDQRLDLEFGNSSFDVRHRLTGNFVAELPFGPNRAFLHSGGFLARALDGFNVSGDYTFATGTYATPQYQNTVSQVATGGNYTLRPDRVFSQPIAGAGRLRNYINPAAFTSPATIDGVSQFGTASRNSIELPGVVGIDASLSRTFTFGDTKNFETRVTASNVFNTVQYSGLDTVLNSATFGQVTGTTQPRKLNFNARYRF